MVTYATVELGEKEAILTDNGKILKLKVQGPENLIMKTWSAAPPNSYDAENPGTTIVGFECEIPANSKHEFEVLLIPENVLGEADFVNLKLEEW